MVRFMNRWGSLVAQILLCVILLPFACFVVSLILPEEGAGVLLNMAGELPVIGIFLGMIGQFSAAAAVGGEESALLILNAVVQAAAGEFESAVILGMCIYILKQLGGMVRMRGVALLPTVAGVLVGSVLLRYIKLDAVARRTTLTFLVCLCAVMAVLSVEKSFVGKVLTVFFGLGLQAVIAAAAGAYACLLFYIAAGGVGGDAGPVYVIQLVAAVSVVLIALLIVDYLLDQL